MPLLMHITPKDFPGEITALSHPPLFLNKSPIPYLLVLTLVSEYDIIDILDVELATSRWPIGICEEPIGSLVVRR